MWATNIWKFNDQHEYTIRRSQHPWLLAQCEHNSIMEKIASLPGINDTELKAVQQCQLYLKAMTISDLTNSAGTAIADWVTNPNLIEHKSRPSLFLYPNQGRPTSTTWNIFITKLQVAYTVGTNNLLTGPLG
jgi:hypothetical protein